MSRSPHLRAFLATLVALIVVAWTHPAGPASAATELRLAGPVVGLDSFDPAISGDAQTNAVLRQVFRGLTAFDDALNPVPEIAETLTASPDGLAYDVALRPDATFHDGSPIEAADVAFSLARAVSPATVGGDVGLLAGPTFLSAIAGFDDVAAGRADVLSGVTVIDARRLSIRLSEPQATFPMRLASVPASIVDREQVLRGADWTAEPNGSGPFRVAMWSPGESLVLDGYDGYVGGPPRTDRVSYRLGAGALQSYNLFQAGQIDIDSLFPLDVPAFRAQQDRLDARLVESDGFSLTYLALRSDVEPLDDPHVRRAVMLAFPRERVAALSLDGQVEPADALVPDGMSGRDWSADLPAFDLGAARAEIARSRYGSPDRVPTIRLDGSGSFAGPAFEHALEDGLGLSVEIVEHDPATFYAELAQGRYAVHELSWSADFPDPATFLESLFASESPVNYLGFADPEVDAALAEASRIDDPAARAARYEVAQQLIVDADVVVPLFHTTQHTVVREGVSGVVVTGMGILRLETISVDA